MTTSTDKVEQQSIEEKLNALTHSIGAGLSIAGLIILLVLTKQRGGSTLAYVSFSIYGSFQILLYLSSSLTHQFSDIPRLSSIFRIIDQAAIYLLIAGTYTPFVLLGLGGTWGWTLFGIIWGLALLGILLKTIFIREKHILSDLLYLPMGWLMIIAIKPMIQVFPLGILKWLIMGGLSYTIGILFYLTKKVPLSHVIWHLFVLSGGIGFYMGFVFYL
ncbi:hemolysin III family protein [Oceanispirochaeta sp.]|jgi:hemolysin III|uniref:PAQR family membrane homeostasis protein TrhA n=1 Tax=Oceanispirochaeta sp. TaxID=2035350 RepID=UPI00262BC8D4|nr:hemolysin III family protein [Oceanispirochaeta sp.]MDA3958509.1 hemolysin III family protein [Oceanispirochaeta sp.]